MIIGVIDIGTNSTRILIARYQEGNIYPLYWDMEITRIGEGMGSYSYIKRSALERTLNCLQRFINKCQEFFVNKIRIAATSAVRDAINKEEVINLIFKHVGYNLEILSGSQEARLSYLGATSDFENNPLNMVLDIGGGSTELVYFLKTKGMQYKSVSIGAVRLGERPELMKNTQKMISELFLGGSSEGFQLIGVGGTVTTLVAIKLGLTKYEPELVHGQKLSFAEVQTLKETLFNLAPEDRKHLKGLQPQRADIIPYGAHILYEVMKMLGCKEITVSEKDILHGLIITSG